MLEGYRSLNDDELVQVGDVVKDLDEGEYYNVKEGTIAEFMVAVPAGKVRTWNGVSDVLRKAEAVRG